ncbi:MAG: alpha/beta fold hydrolase [Myxococcota bacterium]
MQTAAALTAWQPVARRALLTTLGATTAFAADRSPTRPLEVRLGSQHQLGALRRAELDYQTSDGHRMPASVYFAESTTRAPAILLLHGHHSAGRRSMAVIDRKLGYGESAAAIDLARAGFVVFAPDIRTFGETGSRTDHEFVARALLLDGRVAVGEFLRDLARAVDAMAELSVVDPDRIGVAGLSLGGHLSLYLAAVEPRIKAAVVAGYLASNRRTHLERKHCICQYIPGLLRLMDIDDVGLIAAPKPMLYVSGRKDREFPIDQAQSSFRHIRRGYRALGAEDSAELVVHGGRHEWKSPPAIQFLKKHLAPSGASAPLHRYRAPDDNR